jgi:glycosyltransferase involved in cell wall biosynthesis
MLGSDAPHWIATEDTPQSLAHTVLASLQTPAGNRHALARKIAERHPAQAFGAQWQALLGELLGELLTERPDPEGSGLPPAPASALAAPGSAHAPAGGRMRAGQRVHFVHSGSAYLPELAAYRQWLTQRGHAVHVHSSAATVPEGADVVWWICGRVHRSHAQRLQSSWQVHEYASASVSPWAWLKDRVKQFSHPRPHHRIFQSEWLRQRMGLTDQVPFSLRDMGVPSHFLQAQAQGAPDVDLVYLGEMSRLMQFVPALEAIDQAGLRLLLVGQIPPELDAVLARLSHVHTTGRIAQADVPAQLLRARAGLNLVPDRLPLSAQTSTKLLEYLAVGLPVLSNPSAWAAQMAAQHPQRITLMAELSSPAAWQQALSQQPAPQRERQHLQALCWDARLRDLPVWQALGL